MPLFRGLGEELILFVRQDYFCGVIINDVPSFRVDNMPYGGVTDSGLAGRASDSPCRT